MYSKMKKNSLTNKEIKKKHKKKREINLKYTTEKKSNNNKKNQEINTIILYVEDRKGKPRKLIIVREVISNTSPKGIVCVNHSFTRH